MSILAFNPEKPSGTIQEGKTEFYGRLRETEINRLHALSESMTFIHPIRALLSVLEIRRTDRLIHHFTNIIALSRAADANLQSGATTPEPTYSNNDPTTQNMLAIVDNS